MQDTDLPASSAINCSTHSASAAASKMLSPRALTLLAAALSASLLPVSAAPAPQAPSASQASSQATAATAVATTVVTSAATSAASSAATSVASSAATIASQSSSSSNSPQASSGSSSHASTSGYWFANVDHSNDLVWTGDSTLTASTYKVFRNVVTDYGAAGDGTTDDTAAIQKALADGNRCGGGGGVCDSSTITPATLYFPPGKYLVSKALNMYYYTQMVGDATDPPTLLASSDFTGMAVLDADPYDYAEANANGAPQWFVNQNNFFRQIRNFVIDIRQWGGGAKGAGIHWQVAQATSLQNIVFEMSTDAGTAQQGIFMDNGSGGWMSDLTFNGGGLCAFLGSQQFTTRNLTFNNCQTAIFMNWNWGWTLQGVTVNGGNTGLDMSALSGVGTQNQTVGSVVLADSKFSDVEYGVRFSYQNSSANTYAAGGTLILDNVDMTGVSTAAIIDHNNATVYPAGSIIQSWASGHGYTSSNQGTNTHLQPVRQENDIAGPNKASSLLASGTKNLFTQSRPQYETLSASDVMSARSNGCKGDGSTDDTDAINTFLQQAASANKLAYFEHGAYLVKDTITVPSGTKMTGEVWSLIVADSASFNDYSNPKPVFQIGKSGGEQGSFQISDFVFETNGPAPGAVMMEWNMQCEQGDCGMWDTHVRIGGSAGTNLEYPQCPSINGTGYAVDKNCEGVFLMFHATKASSGVYLENTWFWVADHDLDLDKDKQLNIYSARGALFQSQGPVWLWGTASEHSMFYNYQFDGVQALYSGLMQSETPYMQPYPPMPQPFSFNNAYDDPLFTVCSNGTGASAQYCKEAWGMRIYNSKNVLIYSTGLYSFFQGYDQTCVPTRNCQQNMIHIQNSQVDMYAVNTANSVTQIVDDDMGTIYAQDNRNWFTDTIAYYSTSH